MFGFIEKKIKDYAIIRSDHLYEICEKTREQIGYGWQPLGGVVIDKDGRYLQTLVSYE